MQSWTWISVLIILETDAGWFSFFGLSITLLQPKLRLFEIDENDDDGDDDL